MTKAYQSATVTVLRNANEKDAGFDITIPQVIIRLQDGTEKLVARGELT